MGGLKPSVILTPDPARAQVSDVATRRTLRLTATEARVLQKYDGTQTAKELAVWAANEGLAIGPMQVQVFLQRMERAGFIVAAPLVPPKDAPDVLPPDHPLGMGDALPSMRSDLRVALVGGSGATFEVTDLSAHRSFTLYDFEVSIARMLDGKRTAAEVIEGGARIGIPVTLDGLRRFLRQLRAYKLLSYEPADPNKKGPQTTWPLRAPWPEELRKSFQEALRMLRSKRPAVALEYLISMLQVDPTNKEAQEAKARAEAQLRDPIVELTFAELHNEAPRTSQSGPIAIAKIALVRASPPVGEASSAGDAPGSPPIPASPHAEPGASGPPVLLPSPEAAPPSSVFGPPGASPRPPPSAPGSVFGPPGAPSGLLPRPPPGSVLGSPAAPSGLLPRPSPSPAGSVPGSSGLLPRPPAPSAPGWVPGSSGLLPRPPAPSAPGSGPGSSGLLPRPPAPSAPGSVPGSSGLLPRPPAPSAPGSVFAPPPAPSGVPPFPRSVFAPSEPPPGSAFAAPPAPSGVPPSPSAPQSVFAPSGPASGPFPSAPESVFAPPPEPSSQPSSPPAAWPGSELGEPPAVAAPPLSSLEPEVPTVVVGDLGPMVPDIDDLPNAAPSAPPAAGRAAGEAPPPSRAGLPPVVVGAALDEEEEEAPPRRKGRLRWVLIVLLLAGVGALLARPVPSSLEVPCELAPVLLATVVAPRAGRLDSLEVKEGDLVEKDQLLGSLAAAETKAQLDQAHARTAALEKKLEKINGSIKPAEIEKARVALAAKTKELTRATEQRKRLQQKHAPRGAQAKAEKQLRAKQAEVDKATAELARLSQETKLAALQRDLDAVKQQSAALEAQLAAARLTAPEAGRVEGLVAAGTALEEHALVARLVSPARLGVEAKNPGLPTSADPPGATVAGTPVSELHWVKDAPVPLLRGTVPSKDLKPGSAVMTVPAGTRPWGAELLERARALLKAKGIG